MNGITVAGRRSVAEDRPPVRREAHGIAAAEHRQGTERVEPAGQRAERQRGAMVAGSRGRPQPSACLRQPGA